MSILARVAQKDAPAVRECIDRYGALVWSLAKSMSPTEADAEDAVQEIFLDIWNSAGRFDPAKGSEVTFVAMVARRRLIDRHRKSTRQVRAREFTPELDAPASPRPWGNPDDVAKASRALASLPADQQQVLKLSIIHGVSHEKIAQSVGLPLGTVKTHVRRGLMHIREAMSAGARPAEVTR